MGLALQRGLPGGASPLHVDPARADAGSFAERKASGDMIFVGPALPGTAEMRPA